LAGVRTPRATRQSHLVRPEPEPSRAFWTPPTWS